MRDQTPKHGDIKGHGVLGNHGKSTCSSSAQGTHHGVSKSESFYPILQRDDIGESIRKNGVSRVPPKTFEPYSQ